METHNAGYHKKCYDKVGQKEYNRLLARVGKKPWSEANLSSSTVIQHKRTKTELGTELCIFYGERETQQKICVLQESFSTNNRSSANNQHVQILPESWCEMFLVIADLDVHAKLCVGDVRSNEIFYHKNHLSRFYNTYRALQAKKDDNTDQHKKVLLHTYA